MTLIVGRGGGSLGGAAGAGLSVGAVDGAG
ncbi:MAG: hypothetical protein JWP21_2428, partial [Tardiphaga sp.]|nr:hypothetical protein [Tardiphaga sp.]